MPLSLSEKLKRLGVFSGAANMKQPLHKRPPLEDAVGGTVHDTPLGPVVSVETQYPKDYKHGTVNLAEIRISPILLKWSKPIRDIGSPVRVVFLDTETSGLSGGTGTFPFIIGIGEYTKEGFHTTQLLLSAPEHEAGMLYALNRMLYEVDIIVSFNGKSFDLPILNNRYIIHQMEPTFTGFHHIDILHLARRIWRSRLSSRRLGVLEDEVLMFQRSEDDIPGWLVPDIYREYLSTLDATPLTGVLYHNRVDIVSLAAITNYLSVMIDDEDEHPHHHASDRLAAVRLIEEQGINDSITSRYEQLLGDDNPPIISEIIYTQLAKIYRRIGREEDAINLLRTAASNDSVEAAVMLAKIYEHDLRDWAIALEWTEKAILISQNSGNQEPTLALEKRRQRLMKKKKRVSKIIRNYEGTMVEKNVTPLARLQNEIIKQKNISLIKPIGDNAFDRLVSLAHDYQRQVSEIVISVINGGLDPHEIPDGEQFQQVFEQLEADPRINRKHLAQIKNFKESQDSLLELALMVAEENQPTSSAPYIEVYQAQGQLDANIMLAFLDANEIEAFSSQESAGVTYGLTIGPLGLAKIFVRANQYREAHQLIQAMINDQIEDKSEDTDPADLPEEPL